MMTKPHVSVYARFTLKNMPEGQLGLRSEDWNFGKNAELSLHDLALGIISRLTEFYLHTMREKTVDEINAEIKRLSESLSNCSIALNQ